MPIPVINSANNGGKMLSFRAEKRHDKTYDHDTLLKNNFGTNFKIGYDKFLNACTIYPAKGLTGNKNSNFYEFLTMGMVPYFIGSLTLMGVFNAANKLFDEFSKSNASKFGKKMALGVVFYGVAKELSKLLVTKPIALATGVDIDLPYAKINYELPEYKNDTDITSIEYHKVFESVEFPRWDLLYKDGTKPQMRNAYYDKVARKMGLGVNLKDSDQEVKPRIKKLVTMATTVKNIIPYVWAGVGVALAFQDTWDDFFKSATFKFWKGKEFAATFKSFVRSLKESFVQLLKGGKNPSKTAKFAGRALFVTAVAATVIGDLKVIAASKKPTGQNTSEVVKKDRKYIVN